jgi:hypothetical protein
MSKEITCTVSNRYGTAARTCLLIGKKRAKLSELKVTEQEGHQ